MYFSVSTQGFYSLEFHGNNIPGDAVKLTDYEYQELKSAQSSGSTIQQNSPGGNLFYVTPSEPPANDNIKKDIGLLEAKITNRRIRDAVLGIDNGWLAGINDQIDELRSHLV